MATRGRKKRSGRSVAVLASRPRREVVRGEVVTPWQRVPGVARMTTAVLRAHAAAGVATAKAAIDIGRQLAKIRKALAEPGQWIAWIEDAVPFGPRTVQNYLALVTWADREPDHFARFHHLGLSKLYRIAAIPRGLRTTFAVDEPIRIPGGGRKLLDVMTVAELDRVIGGLTTPPVPRPGVEKIVQAYRHRLAALAVLNTELVAKASSAHKDIASELVAELLGLVQELESAFGR